MTAAAKRKPGRPPGRKDFAAVMVRLPPDDAAALDELSTRTRESKNSIIARGLRALLKREA